MRSSRQLYLSRTTTCSTSEWVNSGTPSPPEFDGPETRNAKSTKLGVLIEKGFRQFLFIDDFRDNWKHTVMVEEVAQADLTVAYPRFIAGERRAPPENVGGTWGFEEFVEAMTKPRHREKKAMLEWYGAPFRS